MTAKSSTFTKNSGVAALPAVLIIGGIMMEIGIAGLLIAFLATNSGFSVRLSSEALGAARAGVADAFLKIVRDKNFSSGGYVLSVGDRSSATVTVLKDQPTNGEHKITSLGAALTRRRQLEAVVETNAATGEMRMEYLKETAL